MSKQKNKPFMKMIRKILVFLILLSVHPFSRGQIITQQPVNDSICLGQPEASFTLFSIAPDVTFAWEFRPIPSGTWAPIDESMTDFTGTDNDTLWVMNAANYNSYSFRCALYGAFNGSLLDYSNIAGIVTVQPPVVDFSISQASVESGCYTFCPGEILSFSDQTTDPYGTTNWLWDFGDGNTSVFQDPNHQYLSPGDYTVTLNAWNAYGCSASGQKQLTVLDVSNISINGPEIVCGNLLSDQRDLYYTVTPVCDTCTYVWTLPETHIQGWEPVDATTVKVHWGTVTEAVQLVLEVKERNAACNRDCHTGHATLDVLLKAQQSPDPAFKVIRKAETNAILIYLGDDMALYRWGFTDKTNSSEQADQEWNDKFYDFGSLDLDRYDYWVETSETTSGECWTRSYYR